MAGPILGCQVHESVRRHINLVTNLYEQLLKAGVCREQARGLLPQNMYTEYYGTANLNNILKFVDLRTHEGAQSEIQKVAKAVLKIAKKLYPITVGAYEKAKKWLKNVLGELMKFRRQKIIQAKGDSCQPRTKTVISITSQKNRGVDCCCRKWDCEFRGART